MWPLNLFSLILYPYPFCPPVPTSSESCLSTDSNIWPQNQGKAGHEIQSSTLELINGLVSLVHNPSMPDVAAEAMEALLVLHQPEKIEMWNPEAPINTFWDVRWVWILHFPVALCLRV